MYFTLLISIIATRKQIYLQLKAGGHGCDSYTKLKVEYRVLPKGYLKTKTIFFMRGISNETTVSGMLREEYEFILTVYNNKDITAKTGPHIFDTRKEGKNCF